MSDKSPHVAPGGWPPTGTAHATGVARSRRPVRIPRRGWLRRQVISTLPDYLLAQSISHWLIEFLLSFTYWPSPSRS